MVVTSRNTYVRKRHTSQKKIIRIMKGCESEQSCRELFYEFVIFPLHTQYIFTLLIFINKNKKKVFITNLEVRNYTTRQQTNFHLPFSVALVREQTIPTERPPPVGEVSANFCG